MIAEDLKLPASYAELSVDDVEYISGEWGFRFGGYSEHRFTCAWNDGSGAAWLAQRAGAAENIEGLGLIGVTFGIMELGALIAIGVTTGGAGLLIGAALGVAGIYGQSVKTSAVSAFSKAITYMECGSGYSVYETYWCGITNGYETYKA